MRTFQFGSARFLLQACVGSETSKALRGHLTTIGKVLTLAGILLGGLLPTHAEAQEIRLTDVLTSPNAEEERDFGSPIAEIGDINNDGTSDLLIGAGWNGLLNALSDEEPETGRAYLIDGAKGKVIRILTSPNPEENDEFPDDVEEVGDVNGDGTPDLLIGASRGDVNGIEWAGRAYLFSGSDGRVLKVFSSPDPEPSTPRTVGFSVGDVRNVSNNATPDLLAGAPSESVGGVKHAGRAYLIDIADGKATHTFTSPNPEKMGNFGFPFAEIGDVNGDGTSDLLIGATDESPTGVEKGGRVYIFSGSSGTLLRTLTSPSVEKMGYFGSSIAEPGDVNNDGVPDLLIGSYESVRGISGAGRVYLFSGATGDLLHTFTSPNPEKHGDFGSTISGFGDVNGDNTPDLLIGADSENSDGLENAGRVYIFSGANWQVLHTLTSPNPEKGGLFGNSIAEIRNADRDSLRDLFIGAFRESPGGQEDAGRVYRFQIGQQRARPLVDTDIPETRMNRPNAVAVVIGTKNYRSEDLPDVDYALRDAEVMKRYLTRTLGFREENIIFEKNATGSDLERIFGTKSAPKGQLHDWVRSGKSEVFVYYSGHGAPNPASGNPYLVPSDTNPSYLSQNGYSVNQLYENLAEIPAKSVTVVLESCFSGISEAGPVVRNASPAVLSIENPLVGVKNALAITAGAADQVASWYPEKKHGLFTYFFLRGLKGAADANDDRMVTAREMEAYLTEEVSYRAQRMYSRKQTPTVVGRNKDRVLVEYEDEVPAN